MPQQLQSARECSTIMDWLIAAPFSESASDQWLAGFVPGGQRRFASVVAGYVHDRSRASTSARQWRDYALHGARAWYAARRSPRPTGLITCFPQLPMVVGLLNGLPVPRVPTLAWTFNVGTLPGGARRKVAMKAFGNVDLFVVHSRLEIATCSEWLELPTDRFRFVPLQRGLRERRWSEDLDRPYVVSMGSAQRDYRLLMSVLRDLGYRAIVVCAPHAIGGIDVPPNVEIRTGLSIDQCHELLQRARVNVVPISNMATASGQISLLDAMMYGCATVVTKCPGSVDYVTHERDAMLVDHGDHDQMKLAIRLLWEDDSFRLRLSTNARLRVENEYSDQAVGRSMGKLLDEVEARYHIR